MKTEIIKTEYYFNFVFFNFSLWKKRFKSKIESKGMIVKSKDLCHLRLKMNPKR